MAISITEASSVQQSLLRCPPSVDGVDIAVSWRPFGDVGGDFYDFLEVEEDSLAITLGDVSGKGYDAALLMVYALAEIRARLREHQRLAYVMAALDRSLRDYSSANRFAEVIIGLYVRSMRRFIFVPGGSIMPMAFDAGRGRLTIHANRNFRLPGLPIPGHPNQMYSENTIDLARGDTLLLFTDGVAERLEESDKEILHRDDFGSLVAPSIERICRQCIDGDANSLLAAIEEFLNSLSSDRTDDQTLIVLKAS